MKKNRILNGKQTGINEYPWQAALIRKGEMHPFCGGSLVNDRYVLTAAHCVHCEQERKLTVVLGEHDIRTNMESDERGLLIECFELHPKYNHFTLENDIAVIRLAESINFGLVEHIRPICLPTVEVRVGRRMKISGWGLTENGLLSPFLRKTTVIKVIY